MTNKEEDSTRDLSNDQCAKLNLFIERKDGRKASLPTYSGRINGTTLRLCYVDPPGSKDSAKAQPRAPTREDRKRLRLPKPARVVFIDF